MSDPLDLDAAVDLIAKWNVGSLSPAALGAFMDTVAMALVGELRAARARSEAAQDSAIEAGRQRQDARDALRWVEAERDALAARIEAALALHTPDPVSSLPPESEILCEHCLESWPCPTVAALSGVTEPAEEDSETLATESEHRAGWLAALDAIQGFAGLSDDERLAIDRAHYAAARERAQGIVPDDEAGRR